MTRTYKLDGEIIDWRDLIKAARKYGYDSDITQTSIAARYLRENGHVVECEETA